jgi:hypothetical protein
MTYHCFNLNEFGEIKIDGGLFVCHDDAFEISVPSESGAISLSLHSLSSDFYEFFPFLVRIYLNGVLSAYLEISGEDEAHEVALAFSGVLGGLIHIRITSECAARPIDLNINQDIRNLALRMDRISIRQPRRAQKAKPSQSPTSGSWGERPRARRDAPVFVIGPYRSMTSVTTWLIGQHPHIAPIEEIGWLSILYLGACASFDLNEKGSNSLSRYYKFTKDNFLRWQGSSLNKLHRKLSGRRNNVANAMIRSGKAPLYDPDFSLSSSPLADKIRWVDGTPENTGMAIGLGRMFEEAQFVFMIRDPLEVITSLMHHSKAGGRDMAQQEAVAHWEQFSQWGYEAWQELGPKRVLLTPCRSLVEDPATAVEAMFAFLGEPNFPQAARVLNKKINSSSPNTVPDDLLPFEEVGRLRAIHAGMIAGEALDSLPWSNTLWPFVEREAHMTRALRAALT